MRLKRSVRKLLVDPKPCALRLFRITLRNNLEAFQKPKAIIQESSNCRPSGRKSLVLNDREAIRFQDPLDLHVVQARSDMKFRHVAGAGHHATELGVAP